MINISIRLLFQITNYCICAFFLSELSNFVIIRELFLIEFELSGLINDILIDNLSNISFCLIIIWLLVNGTKQKPIIEKLCWNAWIGNHYLT